MSRVTRAQRVKQWLEDIPDDLSDIDSQDEDTHVKFILGKDSSRLENMLGSRISKNYLPSHMELKPGRSVESVQTMYLQGNKCVLSSTNPLQTITEKPDADDIPKRVTFKADDRKTANEDVFKKKSYRLTPHIQVEDKSFGLEKGMRSFLKKASHRKGNKLPKPAAAYRHMDRNVEKSLNVDSGTKGCVVQEVEQAEESSSRHLDLSDVILDTQNHRIFTPTSERLKAQKRAKSTMSIGSSMKSAASSRVVSRSGQRSAASNYRTLDSIAQKPVITGLVVDSAYNQQPSLVRASKNANLREEYALQQRLKAYRSSCHNTITDLTLAQRRMNSSLAYLKYKIATTSGSRDKPEVGMIEKNQMQETSAELFLRNKGYVPAGCQTTMKFTIPPLIYPKRRLLTVN